MESGEKYWEVRGKRKNCVEFGKNLKFKCSEVESVCCWKFKYEISVQNNEPRRGGCFVVIMCSLLQFL